MSAYTKRYMSGQEVIDHITQTTSCSEMEAWIAFRDAAADGDGCLHVREFKNGQWQPDEIPVGYWKRAAADPDLVGSLSALTNLCWFEVLRSQVEAIWPRKKATEISEPPQHKGGAPRKVADPVADWYERRTEADLKRSDTKLAAIYKSENPESKGAEESVRRIIGKLRKAQYPKPQ